MCGRASTPIPSGCRPCASTTTAAAVVRRDHAAPRVRPTRAERVDRSMAMRRASPRRSGPTRRRARSGDVRQVTASCSMPWRPPEPGAVTYPSTSATAPCGKAATALVRRVPGVAVDAVGGDFHLQHLTGCRASGRRLIAFLGEYHRQSGPLTAPEIYTQLDC